MTNAMPSLQMTIKLSYGWRPLSPPGGYTWEIQEPLGECVPPGGVPRGDRPSWAFPLGWVSGGEEIAIFPSRVSFLFASFSLDKQRERISVLLRVFARGIRKRRSYRAGDRKGEAKRRAPLRHDLKGETKRKAPLSAFGHFPRRGKQGPTRASAPTGENNRGGTGCSYHPGYLF